MKPSEMRERLYEVAARYMPVKPYLEDDGLKEVADDYLELYKTYLEGGSLQDKALEMKIVFNKKAARRITTPLKGPVDFVQQLTLAMDSLVGVGVAIEHKNSIN